MNDAELDWNGVKVFLAVAEQKTLSAAAATLGLSQPTVGRQIARLEAALKLRLFLHKQTGYELTPDGRKLVEIAQKMSIDAAELARVADLAGAAGTETPARITVGAWGLHFLAGRLDALVPDDPTVRIEIFADDAFWNLARSEADLAIRNRRAEHRHLIAQKLGDVDIHAYAAADYCRAHPEASCAADWAAQSWIGYCGSRAHVESSRILAQIPGGAQPRFAVNGSAALLGVLRSGTAMGLLPSWIGEFEDLVRLSEHPVAKRELWLIFHQDLRFHPKLNRLKTNLQTLFRDRLDETRARLRKPVAGPAL